MEKIILGLTEKVKINGKEVLAKIDTGASRNSIDMNLATELNLGPIVRVSKIRSVHGRTTRPVVQAKLEIKGKKFKALFNLISRSRMKYKVLIGRRILKQGFLVDASK